MVKHLREFVAGIPNLAGWSHLDKIKFFAWYIHTKLERDRFNQADIRACYDELHLDKPSNVSSYLVRMQDKKPREVLKDARGYFLERRMREQFDSRFGQRSSTVQVDQLLRELPTRVPSLTERTFLNEALICFRHGAFRAAIVMSWNLAFDHLCHFVLKQHLAAFNAQLPKSFPKARLTIVSKREDFAELKESEVLQVCRSANIITGDLDKIMKEKLNRRNTAAHPSNVVITQLQAEDFISDVVVNIVVKLV